LLEQGDDIKIERRSVPLGWELVLGVLTPKTKTILPNTITVFIF
jgi:hypothetical protein